LRIAEEADLALDTLQTAPRMSGRCSKVDHAHMSFRQIDGAQQGAFEEGKDDLASRFVEEDGQDRR
jgi:hypothetical protein